MSFYRNCSNCGKEGFYTNSSNHVTHYRCIKCNYTKQEFTKLQEFKNYLQNRGHSQEDWENIIDIYGEYLTEDSDLYVFKHHFGLGKTTFGLMMLEKGDIFLQETYDQLKENIEHFKALRPNDSTAIIFGWNTFIGLDKHTNKFPQLKDLQDSHPQRINKLQKLTEKHNGKYARMKIGVKEKETPVLDKYAEQFKNQTWQNNIIFACSKKIDLIEQKTFLKSAEKIIIDEGIEHSFSTGKINDIQKVLLDLGQKTPSGTTLSNQNSLGKSKGRHKKRNQLKNQTINKLIQAQDNQELTSQSPTFIDWNWCNKLTNQGMKELGKLGRESILGILHAGYSNKLSEGNEKYRILHPERGPQTHTEPWGYGNFNPLKEFSEKWRKIAKKKRGGINLRQYQQIPIDYYPGNYSKFEKELWIQALQGNWIEVEELQKFHNIAEFLHNIENLKVMVKINKETQEINEIRYEKPLMYNLLDIHKENNQELLILDATTDEYYIEWMERRWRNYYRSSDKISFYPEELDVRYLGKESSYEKITPNHAADEVRRYYWDFDQKSDTVTRKLINNNFRKFRILVELIERDNKEDTAIISTKQFRETFDTDDRVEKVSHFAVSAGQNWNDIEKTYVIGRPTKPWYVYEEDFMKQYREYQPFDHNQFRRGSFRSEILEPEEFVAEGLISGHVTRWRHRKERKIYNYWIRNLQKPVFDSYFRMRGGERLNVIGFDRFNWIGRRDPEENYYPISHLFAELMDEKYVIENWSNLQEIFPNNFFSKYFDNIATKSGKLRKLYRIYRKINTQDRDLLKALRDVTDSKSTYYRWKKEYEKYNLISYDSQ